VDVIVVLFVLVIGLIGLDVASLRWGVDSRDRLADDHRR